MELVRVHHTNGTESQYGTWREYVADRELRSWLQRRNDRLRVRDGRREREREAGMARRSGAAA